MKVKTFISKKYKFILLVKKQTLLKNQKILFTNSEASNNVSDLSFSKISSIFVDIHSEIKQKWYS